MGTSHSADDQLLNAVESLLQSTTTIDGYRFCVLARKINDLRPDVQEVLNRLLDSNKSSREIHRAFQKGGFAVSREAISQHRTGECICGGQPQ